MRLFVVAILILLNLGSVRGSEIAPPNEMIPAWLDQAEKSICEFDNQPLITDFLTKWDADNLLNTPDQRNKIIRLALLEMEKRDRKDPIKFQKRLQDYLNVLIPIFNYMGATQPIDTCNLDEKNIRSLFNFISHIGDLQANVEPFLSMLKAQAKCEGITWSELVSKNAKPYCFGNHSNRPLIPQGKSCFLGLNKDDQPFFPNGSNIMKPEGYCFGHNMYSIFIFENFRFDPYSNQKLTFSQRYALANYNYISDSSGEKLRSYGFKQDEDGKFIIPGYKNLREFTEKNPDLISSFSHTFSDFYSPPDLEGYLGQIHVGPEDQIYSNSDNITIQSSYEVRGYWYDRDTTPMTEAFDDIYRVSAQSGTVLIGIKYGHEGSHSLLVRASEDPNVLIVYENNSTQLRELSHIYKMTKPLKREIPGFLKRNSYFYYPVVYESPDDPYAQVIALSRPLIPSRNVFYQTPDSTTSRSSPANMLK